MNACRSAAGPRAPRPRAGRMPEGLIVPVVDGDTIRVRLLDGRLDLFDLKDRRQGSIALPPTPEPRGSTAWVATRRRRNWAPQLCVPSRPVVGASRTNPTQSPIEATRSFRPRSRGPRAAGRRSSGGRPGGGGRQRGGRRVRRRARPRRPRREPKTLSSEDGLVANLDLHWVPAIKEAKSLQAGLGTPSTQREPSPARHGSGGYPGVRDRHSPPRRGCPGLLLARPAGPSRPSLNGLDIEGAQPLLMHIIRRSADFAFAQV